jgi:hypothetical protein
MPSLALEEIGNLFSIRVAFRHREGGGYRGRLR